MLQEHVNRELVNLHNMDDYPFELENFDPENDEITSEVIEHELSATDRSVARRASLQILYEIDTTQHLIGEVLDAHLRERPESGDVLRLITTFVHGVMDNIESLDALIQKHAPEWPIDQVATIDRNILRIATYEFAIQKRHTPVPVIINEAVHLAQIFGAENAHSFIHGVLGAITAGEDPDQSDNQENDEVEAS